MHVRLLWDEKQQKMFSPVRTALVNHHHLLWKLNIQESSWKNEQKRSLKSWSSRCSKPTSNSGSIITTFYIKLGKRSSFDYFHFNKADKYKVSHTISFGIFVPKVLETKKMLRNTSLLACTANSCDWVFQFANPTGLYLIWVRYSPKIHDQTS